MVTKCPERHPTPPPHSLSTPAAVKMKALSEAELEYNPQHVSKAIYATFTLVNLPPKMAEAAGELECVSSLAILLGTELESVGTFTGAELEGGVCQHPTISGKEVPLLPANLLTMGKGTGLVHTAPAHGMEDYSVASQFELTVECMVDEEGRFNELAGPELQNQSVMGEGNYTVISMLKAVRALVKEEECVHSYPDDRGSKQPVVIRPTQLVVLLETENDGLAKMCVMPESARGSLFAQLDRRPSWCISQQRSWGMPITVFYHIETGEPLMNKAPVVHDFVVSEKGEKVLCNLVDPDTVIHGEGRSAVEYELTIEIEPGLLFELSQSLLHPANGADGVIMDHPEQRPAQRRALADALISKVNFLINLEDGVIHEDSAYQVAAVPTSMVRCARCRRYTSVSPDCPCQIILTRAQ
ncbi:isoleucine--tRNA ligase, mitochondrial-like [Salmo salar]|uniref:Isoleucine--tRNA ligase, mitochondrial-like n=1 Tax=Salmo salar TaxID=8030 RepID=A0ABM3F7L1_SALSA|nr:isoleucine--tRNA ligase, mitochondrial-like [Salmo salar]